MPKECQVCGEHGDMEQCSNCGAVMCDECMSGHGCDPDCNLSGPLEEGLFGDRYMEYM